MQSINTKQIHKVPIPNIFPVSALQHRTLKNGGGFYALSKPNGFLFQEITLPSLEHMKTVGISILIYIFGKSGLHFIHISGPLGQKQLKL